MLGDGLITELPLPPLSRGCSALTPLVTRVPCWAAGPLDWLVVSVFPVLVSVGTPGLATVGTLQAPTARMAMVRDMN